MKNDLGRLPFVDVYVTDNCATRPWRSDDLDILRASESLFAPPAYPQRFLTGGRLQPFHLQAVNQLAAPRRRWTGQVALEADRLVALAECSWEPADPDSATLIVNVARDWQAGGIGRRTLRDLVSRCLDMGLTTFTMDYAASNVTPSSMLQAIGAEADGWCSLSAVTPPGLGHMTVRAASWTATTPHRRRPHEPSSPARTAQPVVSGSDRHTRCPLP